MVRPTPSDGSHNKALQIVENETFKAVITTLIVLNAITLGLETYDGLPDMARRAIHAFDIFVVGVFVIELTLKIFAWRLSFFRSGWNIFDLVIVIISLLPGARPLQVLRSLRVLRVLRLLHVVPMMRRIVEALFSALPGMGAILAVLGVLVYASAVMATSMYGNTENEEVQALFGDLPASAFTLFQVMTMDGWRNEVVQKVMDDGHPFAWVFFLCFIFLASFAVLNLFIALIVEALQADQEEAIEQIEDAQEESHRDLQTMLAMMKELKDEVRQLRAERDGSNNEGGT
ncbi:ion transporter [Ponticaulis sp.]|uniref:ion transporter n=1 Tax=Ponticaulis sp. TaxID=2020902 RepID=UPI000B7662F3|nr:ion transporter [Ponticaulis sp.]MAI90039.1 voltage-gated sodium channel [Ponticaulis sp.]OUX99699.1 MAG: voltage-gated sodium channel [Hyphomonadaceae bacterium TMED5]|tara:strand:+ start:42976 stop:43839 length:864 start_codon:yes stop_codon:yes gene_type:complete